MLKSKLYCVCFLLLCTSNIMLPKAQADNETRLEEVKPAIVSLFSISNGEELRSTAFLCAKRGGKAWLVTAKHAIASSAESVTLILNDEKHRKVQAKVVAKASDCDLALINTKDIAFNDVEPLLVGPPAIAGATTFAIGSPVAGRDLSVKRCSVESSGEDTIDISGSIAGGNSGSPLLDEDLWRVQGVVVKAGNNAVGIPATAVDALKLTSFINSVLPATGLEASTNRKEFALALQHLIKVSKTDLPSIRGDLIKDEKLGETMHVKKYKSKLKIPGFSEQRVDIVYDNGKVVAIRMAYLTEQWHDPKTYHMAFLPIKNELKKYADSHPSSLTNQGFWADDQSSKNNSICQLWTKTGMIQFQVSIGEEGDPREIYMSHLYKDLWLNKSSN